MGVHIFLSAIRHCWSALRILQGAAGDLYAGYVKYDFNQAVERRDTDSIKWALYPPDVIPLWVADMDFVSADPIIQALNNRAKHRVFGYNRAPQALVFALQSRLQQLYGWEVSTRDLVFLPGLVTGINIAIQAFTSPGESVLAQPPVYFHFLRDPVHHGRLLQDPPLVRNGDRYEIDFDLFERAITDNTKLFILCNPHNPVGRVYTKAELEKLADICLRHSLIICSDEIHCDLVFPPHQHIPIATLGLEVEAQTVTLMAPSKTYNIAGLECGYAVIKNPKLRNCWKDFSYGIIPHGNIMGFVAALAALEDGQEWLDQVVEYLLGNRDCLVKYLRENIPLIRACEVEATYLAWLDCTELGLSENPSRFFLDRARVGLSDGEEFGKGGKNFVRLNFACPQIRLNEALDRMKNALKNG
jgi:cystathionine beta-lyase